MRLRQQQQQRRRADGHTVGLIINDFNDYFSGVSHRPDSHQIRRLSILTVTHSALQNSDSRYSGSIDWERTGGNNLERSCIGPKDEAVFNCVSKL